MSGKAGHRALNLLPQARRFWSGMVYFLSTITVNLNEKGAAGFPAAPSFKRKPDGFAAGFWSTY